MTVCARGSVGTWTTGGAGGGAQCARGAKVGILAQPALEGADGGQRSSGEDGMGKGPAHPPVHVALDPVRSQKHVFEKVLSLVQQGQV